MKKQLAIIATAAATLLISANAMAHSLWVNLDSSFTHPPGHALSSIGWGHTMPLDDFLASDWGNVEIGRYVLISPDAKETELPLPVIKKEKATRSNGGMDLEGGDLGLRKFTLTDKTEKGTWQVVTDSKVTYFSQYVDKKGKVNMATKPMDRIRGAASFNFSARYKAEAKSYMTVGQWSQPGKAGHELEITPTCDLSNVRVGDLVTFEVTLKGKKLNCDMDGMNILNASSNAFGGPDHFCLASNIMDGKAQFRIPVAGAWRISTMVRKEVTADNELKDLQGKCTTVYYSSTLTLKAKP